MNTPLKGHLKEQLKTLSEAVGVSGAEGEVRKLIIGTLKEQGFDPAIDSMGSVSVVRKGTGDGSRRVLVSAHMDEIGFMITEMGDDGLIHITDVGTHDDRFASTQRLLVGKEKAPGVFLWLPIHKSVGQNNLVKTEDMLIDVGAADKSSMTAKIGESVAYASRFTELSPVVMRGKAFDSRAACVVLIALLSGDPFPFDLHAVFTTQALIGGRGGAIAAYRTNPQAAFVLTGFAANDLPGNPDAIDFAPTIRLGAGPVIGALDGRVIANRLLIKHIRKVADAMGISYQFHASNGAQQPEGGAINLAQAGIPMLTIGVPIRYMGSPNTLLNLNDLQAMIDLLRESLNALTSENLEQSHD